MHSSVSRISSIGNSSVSSVFAKHKGSLREVPAKEVGSLGVGGSWVFPKIGVPPDHPF